MNNRLAKPFVYIASPYTKGDVAINTRFQMETFNRLLTDGLVLPYAPLVSHFQHLIFPQPYEVWLNYDLSILPLFDAALRLPAKYDSEHMDYFQFESSGADKEVEHFSKLGIPVFPSIAKLYDWYGVKKP
jgi:hypothetical protein